MEQAEPNPVASGELQVAVMGIIVAASLFLGLQQAGANLGEELITV